MFDMNPGLAQNQRHQKCLARFFTKSTIKNEHHIDHSRGESQPGPKSEVLEEHRGISQGICCQVRRPHVRRRFAKIYKRLGNRVRVFQNKIRTSTFKNSASNKTRIQGFPPPFFALFLGPTSYDLSRGHNFYSSAAPSATSPSMKFKIYTRRPPNVW